jgi:hypothetical protein
MMIYRSIMMVILMLSITWLTDPKLFAGVTPSGNNFMYAPMSPKKGFIDPITGKETIEVEFVVQPAQDWLPSLLKYEAYEYTNNKGYIDRKAYFYNKEHSIPRSHARQSEHTVYMRIMNASCDFYYIGKDGFKADERATEKDSGYVDIKN